ncbi:TOBE domain-containing protein [Celerinatantimonas sp. YJH-8]|uniref:TOBE domain-containing protein n=1 Tax=Celerinatantimonas sp. YJH-8 TaxID=3228714 RepID=UPI0038C5D86F
MELSNRDTFTSLQFQVSGQTLMSEQRIRLLEAIHQHGSLSAAAKALPMSYKAAWDALDTMNNLAEKPLVIRQSGGKHGGGTQLTEAGVRLIHVYRALQAEYQQALQQIHSLLEQQPAIELEQLRRLLRRIHFRSSARNQFSGQVCEVKRQGVHARVSLAVSGSDNFKIQAAITAESVDELGLEEGVEVLALIKAPQLKIARIDDTPRQRVNSYQGVIDRISQDERGSQVNVALASHKHLAVLLSRANTERLALTEGQSVWVSFAPSSVVLCRYD